MDSQDLFMRIRKAIYLLEDFESVDISTATFDDETEIIIKVRYKPEKNK